MATNSSNQPEHAGRNFQPSVGQRPVHGIWIINLILFLVALSVTFILAGAGFFGFEPQIGVRVVGYLGMFMAFATSAICLLLQRIASTPRTDSHLASRVDELAEAVRRLSEQSVLSDDARRLLNRQAERELLCRAIEQDIQQQDWDAAIVLCEELATRFGYRVEAEQFRARIDQARAQHVDQRVGDAIATLDGLIVQRRWDAAFREAARIARLYPDSPRVENLRARVEQARSVYKADLERRFLDAANEQKTELAMELLKELDAYLTESEAEPFREVARGVVGRHRDNLGAQFKMAVKDRRWPEAAGLGKKIINEFPNTRMAQEVRGLLDNILAKANA